MQIGCGKAHRKVALFFIPNELWKSAKWKQTEGLIRWSRFWCPGSNENQAASTIIHHHHAALHAPSQQSQYIGTAAEKVSEGLASEGSSLCLTSRRLVLLLLLFRLPQNHTIAYWFPRLDTVVPAEVERFAGLNFQNIGKAHCNWAERYYYPILA